MDRDDQILAFVQGRMTALETRAFEADMRADKELATEVAMLTNLRDEFAKRTTEDATIAWHRFALQLEQTLPQPANTNRAILGNLLKVAAIAVATVAIWEMVVSPSFEDDKKQFVMASDADSTRVLQIRFNPLANVEAMSAAVYELGGSIVSGPSALGLFLVEFEDKSARDSAAEKLAENDTLVLEILQY